MQGRAEREGALPLFEQESLEAGIEAAVRTRLGLEREPDDTPAIVRAKERALADLAGRGHAASRWARLLDLWCAGWFWTDGPPPDRAVFAALTDAILHGRSALPAAPASALLERARTIAAQRRFLHWPLVFPEVFADGHGRPAAAGGFDAVIGNPPWEMLRGDTGADDVRNARREESRHLAGFVRESGVYRVESRAHVNQYQLFVERALQIVKPGGRVGLVLPSGIASDTGAAALRRHLFDAADVDTLTVLDNRRRVFPIHRSLRIALLTCTSARPTHAIACRFGVTRVEDLDAPAGDRAGRVVLTRGFLTRISGADDLGLPDFTSDRDLRIVERIHDAVPWLSSERGWAVSFGRELNASDDRHRFVPYSGRPPARPVVEGKQVSPFRVAIDRCRFELAAGAADRIARHPRVAYRDVASATNRLTLIAAVVPASAVTTHTLFCVRTRLTAARQQVLCALLNSFVANYLVRLRVTTHVTVSLVSRLPVPNVTEAAPAFTKLAGLARALAQSSGDVEETSEYAALQGCAAHLYGLSIAEYEHVLSTFPLMSDAVKERSLVCFLRTFDLRE